MCHLQDRVRASGVSGVIKSLERKKLWDGTLQLPKSSKICRVTTQFNGIITPQYSLPSGNLLRDVQIEYLSTSLFLRVNGWLL